MAKISNMLQWNGVTRRSRWRCKPLTATCIFLQRLATEVRWTGIETKYDVFAQQLSEIFWEIVEAYTELFGYLLVLRADFLMQRAPVYAEAISNAGEPLEKCM